MTTPNKASRDGRLAKNGGILILATTALLGFYNQWEDGGKKIPEAGYTVYADKLAGGLPTTCGGVTSRATSEPVIVGDTWSSERCDRVIREVTANFQYGVLNCVSAPLTQNQFDAMSSFAHNVGITAACGSRAFGLIDARRYIEGCRAMAQAPGGAPVWSSVRTGKTLPNGKPEMKFVQGLANRRQAEVAMCLKP